MAVFNGDLYLTFKYIALHDIIHVKFYMQNTYRFLLVKVCTLFLSKRPVVNMIPPIRVAIRSTKLTTTPTGISTDKTDDVTVSIVLMMVEAVLVVFGSKVFTALETSGVSDTAAAIKDGASTVEAGGDGGSDDGDGEGDDARNGVLLGCCVGDGLSFGCCVGDGLSFGCCVGDAASFS